MCASLTCTSSDSRIQRLIVCAAICYLDKWFAIVFDSMNELPIIYFPLIRVQAIPFIFGLVGMCLQWKLRTLSVVLTCQSFSHGRGVRIFCSGNYLDSANWMV